MSGPPGFVALLQMFPLTMPAQRSLSSMVITVSPAVTLLFPSEVCKVSQALLWKELGLNLMERQLG